MNFFKQVGSYLTLFKMGKIGNVEAGVLPNDVVNKAQLDLTGGSAPYKRYVAILAQSGTSAPTAIVLENTIGVISFSYDGVGAYSINSSALFTANKTWFISGNQADLATILYVTSTSQLQINTFSGIATAANNMIFNLAIEIRVYQ